MNYRIYENVLKGIKFKEDKMNYSLLVNELERTIKERDSKIVYLETMIKQMKDDCDGGCALDECVCKNMQWVTYDGTEKTLPPKNTKIIVKSDTYESIVVHETSRHCTDKWGELCLINLDDRWAPWPQGEKMIQKQREDYEKEIVCLRIALERIIEFDTKKIPVNPFQRGRFLTVEEFPGPCAKIAMGALRALGIKGAKPHGK